MASGSAETLCLHHLTGCRPGLTRALHGQMHLAAAMHLMCQSSLHHVVHGHLQFWQGTLNSYSRAQRAAAPLL